MPRPLQTVEFNILQSHADSGDRIAYYEQLSEWGYTYAELALGVVNNDTFSGAIANTYFLNEAAEEGVLINGDQLATISHRLMLADLAARRNFEGSESGLELPVNDIKNYHEVIFGQFGVSDNAWTPNFALESLTTVSNQEALWDALLNPSTPFTNPIAEVIEGDFSNEAADYRSDLGRAVFQTTGDSMVGGIESNPAGPYSIEIGNGGFIIGGGVEADGLFGSTNNDVLLGFDGNDILLGGEGNDRLYGGEGVDFINGGAGDDIIGLEPSDDLISLDPSDGDADIIAVGQGFDWITGQGDAEDRLVLPTELLLAPSEVSDDDEDGPDGSTILFQGTGTASGNGIPICRCRTFFS